jgi:nicotinamidase/pyrazinamidase
MNALILVDIQYDFCPGGSLAVPEGDKIVPLVNRLQKKFDLVVATQDWHPRGHGSFASAHGKPVYAVIDIHGSPQTLWPDHCVQDSHGAELVAALETDRIARIFKKGTDPRIDSYSGFLDADHKKSTGLADYLREQHVKGVTIAGLATDYCVKYTALDAAQLGFEACVVADACRGVNLQPGDSEAAIRAMKTAGVKIIQSSAILKTRKKPAPRKPARKSSGRNRTTPAKTKKRGK